MLKQLVNECLIRLRIVPTGPILIKSGIPTLSGPDMAFVTTWRNGRQEMYLPGSSLKGVLRSHAERIARTLSPAASCNPFKDANDPEAFCGACFEARKKAKTEQKGLDNPTVYSDSCPICRLFGSTWYSGRLATEDAYAIDGAPRPEQRDGVGIDRFTGGAAQGAKFDLEVVTSGTFITHLHLRNFELWQLGLLGFLVADLKDRLIRVGTGKSRGLGQIEGTVEAVRLDYVGPNAPQPADGTLSLKGVGGMVSESVANEYSMACPDEVRVPAPEALAGNTLRKSYHWQGTTFPWDVLGPLWVQKAENYDNPTRMIPYRAGRRR